MKKRLYSPKILPLMQALSATLADIDFAHERELEVLESQAGDPALIERRRRALAKAHQERRAPYVQQLAVLQSRIRAGMPDARSDAA